MSPNPDRKGFRVGIGAMLGLLVLVGFVLMISSRQKWGRKRISFHSRFQDAQGLKEGDSVWFQGVAVGYVKDIRFVQEKNKAWVVVNYRVEEQLLPMLHGSTRATISNVGLLGDKYLALVPSPEPPADDPNLLPESLIPTQQGASLAELGRGAEDLMASITEIADNMASLTGSIQHGGGVISRLLLDPELGKETMDRMNHIASQLDGLVTALHQGRGAAGALVMDPKGKKAISDLSDGASALAKILQDASQEKGALGVMLAPGGRGETLINDLSATAADLQKMTKGLSNPKSLIPQLMGNPKTGKETAEHIRSAAAHLDSILRKIDSGKGTVGALINNRDVYETVAAIVKGIQESKIVRWYLKRKAIHAAKTEAKKEAKEVAQKEKTK